MDFFLFKDVKNSETGHLHPVFLITCHTIEEILEDELPHVHASFQRCGYPASQICQHWIRQCFLNYLDWGEIVLYLTASIVLDVDYQIYFCISVLKHLEKDILSCCHDNNLALFLRNSPIANFKFTDYIDFMMCLHEKYSDIIFTRFPEPL